MGRARPTLPRNDSAHSPLRLNPMTAWHLVTRFGDSTLLMPCAAVVFVWLLMGPDRRDRRNAVRWMLALGIAMIVVVASKLAFMGWGIGSRALDFTGVSGHGMMSAAIWPVLACLLVPRTHPRAAAFAVLVGTGLAVLVAASRLVLGLHSPAEAAAGLAVGFAASGAFIAWADKPLRAAPALAAATVALLAVAAPVPAMSLPTHRWLEAVAMQLSGRDRPYQRDDWHDASTDATPLRAAARGTAVCATRQNP